MLCSPTRTDHAQPVHLHRHLARSLGTWPPRPGAITITTSPRRADHAWDGSIVTAEALRTPYGTVVSVPSPLLGRARHDLVDGDVATWLATALPGERVTAYVYRWLGPGEAVADLDDVGHWTAPDAAPAWLRPFNGGVLVATIGGEHAAAVGIKRHDDHAHEIAVVTSERHRGHGLARRLVAQATRAIHAREAVALYLHAPDNHRSRHVADTVGYPDDGWQLLTTAT